MTLRHTLRRWRDRLTLMISTEEAARQYGAIPYRLAGGSPFFLIITSRRSGRWIFPKGGPIAGKTPWEAAAHEAFEEAGVEGEVETVPVGAYCDVKAESGRRVPIKVDLYPLRVLREIENWPEKASRQRRWVSPSDAQRLLAIPQTAELAAALAQRLAQAPPVTSHRDS